MKARAKQATDRVDTQLLTALIERCFDLSMNADLDDAAQASFLAAGKRLRGYLLKLVSARFEARTTPLLQANAALGAAQALLDRDLKRVENAQAAVKKLADLAGKLDGALAAAAKVV
jgi:geranylgeranyl pyrophosphate synthase